MATYKTSNATNKVNKGNQNLTASGDTSSTTFTTWHTHTQTLEGMWQRRWVYNTVPNIGGVGAPSACPTVSYSYLDVYVTEHVVETLEQASYASGYQQLQDIDYMSDASTQASGSAGGFGLSGIFYTASAGIIRKVATLTGPSTDTADNCSRTFNVQVAKQPGAYDPTLDTSSTFNPFFYSDVILPAIGQCRRFNPNIVDI